MKIFSSKIIRGASVVIETADVRDIGRLAEMYRSVNINKSNYKLRFDPKNKQNFRNSGGIFNALSETDIAKILSDDDSCILTAKHNGKIIGLLWFSQSDPSFLNSGFNDENAINFRDVVVAGAGNLKRISHLLLYEAITISELSGYERSLSEIYKVMYYDDGYRNDIGMLNERSFNSALSAGGRLIGELSPKIVSICSDLKIGVLSQVLVFEHKAAIKIIREKIGELYDEEIY